jgi:hypothetical protein
MLQQLRNPFRIFLVGLATWHILDMLRRPGRNPYENPWKSTSARTKRWTR